MCGIAGLFYPSNEGKIAMDVLCTMTKMLEHRGPDSEGFYCKGPVGLGARRLRIIDLDTGDQPICNEFGTVWTVFNGEIYNFAELRNELIQRGHIFKTKTDTEVIVHQYEEDGERCVEKFRGMFAFAVWDVTQGRLLLARDHFGIKPMFVAEENGRLAFASEMKALFTLSWVDLAWREEGIKAYLALGYTPQPLTVYKGIRKLGQGVMEVWQEDQPGHIKLAKRYRYWKPAEVQRQPLPTFEQAVREVGELLEESVSLQLRSDVPLGAFLSGGLDSTSVVALMRKCGVRDLKTFSIGFEDSRFNELDYANLAAKYLKTEHYTQTIASADAEEIYSLFSRFDEPFGDSSAIPTYCVSRLAREHVTVSLSGDGGDELFGGYLHYSQLKRYQRFDLLPQFLRHMIGMIGSRVIPEKTMGGAMVRRLGERTDYRFLSLVTRSFSGYIRNALSPRFLSFIEDTGAIDDWKKAYICDGSVTAAQLVDQNTLLVDDFLVKVDRSSMAVSLEVRVPFLDHRLAEYINGLPDNFKLRNGRSKILLRQAMADCVPREILNRSKKGFGVPLRAWLLGPMFKHVKNVLIDNGSGIFDSQGVLSLAKGLQEGSHDLSDIVWKLLMLGIWAEQRVSNRPW